MGTINNYIHWNCDAGLTPLLRSKKEREIVDKKSWQDIIIDPSERKVFEALADRKYVYRTIEGLARSSGLAANEVREIIIKYFNLVRKSPFPDRKGKDLYTLQDKPESAAETLNKLRAFVSKSTKRY